MTSTKDINFAGLSVVLQPLQSSSPVTPLHEWLADFDTLPIWIPLRKTNGISKIMPVLPQPQSYPNLMQVICQQIGSNSSVEWREKPYSIGGVEVDSHSLHTIQLNISTFKPFPPTLSRAIHALCLRWFANTSSELAEKLHQQATLPMTIGLKYCSPKQSLLRISLLQKELLAPLLWGMNADLGNEIVLAGIPCRLGGWVDIIQSSSYERLVQIPAQKTIEFQFLTPTSFKQNQNIQPFPLPELVFKGLLRRWNTFAPQELHFPQIEWNGVVSGYELKTYAMKMEGGAEIGAEGKVKYRFKDSEQARIATILAHFACYSGIGRKTGMGMGQVTVNSEQLSTK